MSVKSLRKRADNRSTANRSKINTAVSPYEQLRHALEWVMSEARAMPPAQVPTVVDRVVRVANELNERNRP